MSILSSNDSPWLRSKIKSLSHKDWDVKIHRPDTMEALSTMRRLVYGEAEPTRMAWT